MADLKMKFFDNHKKTAISRSYVVRLVYKVIDKNPPNAFVSLRHYTRILSMTFVLHLNCKSVIIIRTPLLK